MGLPDYTPQQVTMALRALALNNGDVVKTADELINDEFMVGREALHHWMHEAHPEQYGQLVKQVMAVRERDAANRATEIIALSGEMSMDLIRAVAEIRNPQLMPQALRALTYAGSKQATILMQLTGRPVDGKQGTSVEDMTHMVQAMAEKGLISIAPEVAATLEPADIVEEQEDSGG